VNKRNTHQHQHTLLHDSPVVQGLGIGVALLRELGQDAQRNGQRLHVVLHELRQVQQRLQDLCGWEER